MQAYCEESRLHQLIRIAEADRIKNSIDQMIINTNCGLQGGWPLDTRAQCIVYRTDTKKINFDIMKLFKSGHQQHKVIKELRGKTMGKYTIEEAREKSGIDAENIYKCIGVSKSDYYRYELGNYMPARVLEKFSLAVDVPTVEIKCRAAAI